jgi:hypothetical protein
VARELITSRGARGDTVTARGTARHDVGSRHMGSVIKKRRKRMAKKKHRKLLKKTRVQRRNKK